MLALWVPSSCRSLGIPLWVIRGLCCVKCVQVMMEKKGNSMIASSQVLCVRFSTAKRDGAGDENMRWERRKKRRSESKAEPTDRQI